MVCQPRRDPLVYVTFDYHLFSSEMLTFNYLYLTSVPEDMNCLTDIVMRSK